MTSLLRIFLILGLLGLGGCRLFMAGHTPDYGLIVTCIGDFDMVTVTMPFEMTYEGLGVTCTGIGRERKDGVTGLTGGFTCSDGRTGSGKSKLVGSDSGTGYFDDNCGNSFTYVWGMSEASIRESLESFRRMRKDVKPAAADKCNAPKPKPVQQAGGGSSTAAAAMGPDEERLVQLKRLFDKGLIDEAEYKVEKKAVLRQMLAGQPAAAEPAPRVTYAPPAPVEAGAIPAVDFGDYHALVIGNDNYRHLPKLNTAINDATAISKMLEESYGFDVTLLLNAGRADIIETLDHLTEALGGNDNLLIYYAGHGWLDEGANRGYWLPVDAKPNRRTNWVSNATLTDTLRTLRAKHVMVVADSCFSGTLTRSAHVGLRAGDYWRRMAKKWARVALVSGGLEPVSDGTGVHSPFAKAFLTTLGANGAIIDGTQLFEKIRRPVMTAARQTPEYADVREAGHDGGDFLFVRRR